MSGKVKKDVKKKRSKGNKSSEDQTKTTPETSLFDFDDDNVGISDIPELSEFKDKLAIDDNPLDKVLEEDESEISELVRTSSESNLVETSSLKRERKISEPPLSTTSGKQRKISHLKVIIHNDGKICNKTYNKVSSIVQKTMTLTRKISSDFITGKRV